MIVGSSGTCSSQELSSVVAEGSGTTVASCGLATCRHHGQRHRFTVSGAGPPHFGSFWSISIGACGELLAGAPCSCGCCYFDEERERERERSF